MSLVEGAVATRGGGGRAPLRILSIAGSDSGGGAGMAADLRTIAVLGGHGLAVLTAVTAQDSRGVRAVHALPPRIVRAQLEAVLGDIGADAVKIGMLATAATVREVAAVLRPRGTVPVVLDPVLRASTGRVLLPAAALRALVSALLPLAAVLTPNLDEAGALLGRPVRGRARMPAAARELLRLGPRAVLLKGGHLRGPAADFLTDGVHETWLESPRAPNPHTHGSGCVLSTALACHLAAGLAPTAAARRAKGFITRAVRAGYPLGAGRGPVNPAAAAGIPVLRGPSRGSRRAGK